MNLPKPRLLSASRALLALLSLSLASCSMPAREAWRIIQKEGLLSYLNAELQQKGKPGSPQRQSSYLSSNPWQPKKRPQPAAPTVAAPKYEAPLAKDPAPAAKPPVVNNETAGISRQSSPKKPSSAPTTKPSAEAKKSPPATSTTKKTTPPAAAKKEAATTKAPVPALQLPYGELIPNRPGMVHSPFAAKHQIVDVEGLRPGQEVKCPYTGKLFRVPGQEQASEPKAKEQPAPPPAAKPAQEKPAASGN